MLAICYKFDKNFIEEVFLKNDANIDSWTLEPDANNGKSPLMLAIELGETDTAELLIKNRAIIDEEYTDKKGMNFKDYCDKYNANKVFKFAKIQRGDDFPY